MRNQTATPSATQTATRLIVLLALILSAFVSGCAVDTAPEPPPPALVFHAYTACTTVTDSAPNDDCSAGQNTVTRCTNATESPDTDHCTGPAKNPAQASGVVWCCL